MTKIKTTEQEILAVLLASIAEMQASKPRGKAVPCIVEWKLFSSFTDAAYWLARNRPELWMHTEAATHQDAYRVMRGLISLTRNRCRAGSDMGPGPWVDGWFCAEEGNPTDWDVPPSEFMDDVTEFEDLRR